MKTKIAIIAFGELATVVANYNIEIDKSVEITGRTCILGLTTQEDAELCVRNILTNHKEGESYLFISGPDEVSKMYAEIAMSKIPGYPATVIPSYGIHHGIDESDALNPETGTPYLQRAFNNLWEKARPKNSKRERKEFRGNASFPMGFFTPGTKCIVDVNHVTKGPREIEVMALASNGPNSYVVVTNEISPFTEIQESYHISHVKEIISHKPGRLKFEDYSSSPEAKERRANDFRRMSDSVSTGLRDKHPSQYRTYAPEALIHTLMNEFVKEDQVFDSQKLVKLLMRENIFHVDRIGESNWGIRVYTVSKKKLRKAIRRLHNKCLVPLFQAELQRHADDEEYYRQEAERDMERDYPGERNDDDGDDGFHSGDDEPLRHVARSDDFCLGDEDDIRSSSFYSLGDEVDVGDQVREGLQDVLSPSEQRMEDSHNRMMDEEAEMERYGVTSMADLLLEKVADDWVQAANSYPVNPSLGELLREKIARDNAAEVEQMLDAVEEDLSDTEFAQMQLDNEKGRERITHAYATDADGKKHDLRDIKSGFDLFAAVHKGESIFDEPSDKDK